MEMRRITNISITPNQVREEEKITNIGCAGAHWLLDFFVCFVCFAGTAHTLLLLFLSFQNCYKKAPGLFSSVARIPVFRIFIGLILIFCLFVGV